MKNRRIGIATKIFFIVMIMLIVSDAILGISIFRNMRNAMEIQLKDKALDLANCAAELLDGERFDALRTKGTDSEEFQEIYDTLTVFLEKGGVEYVYSLRMREDGSAEYVVDPDPEETTDIGEDFDGEPAMEEAFAGQPTVADEITTDEWGEHLTAYSPIYLDREVVGLVGVDLSASQIGEQTKRIAAIIFLICGIVLAVGLIVMFILGHILRVNFSMLNNKVIELTLGNGDLTREIDITTGDEIETIAGNVNELLAYMRNIMKNISSNSNDLQQVSKLIVTNLNDVEGASSEISDTIESMSSSMEETSVSMNQISENMVGITEAVDGMVGKIESGMERTNTIRQNVLLTGNEAGQKKDAVEEQVHRMEQRLEDKIEKSRAVEQINELTENIISITSQTNLLSLNASIEAARAGEAGRGFAVVAGEIGKLAEDSAEAAGAIRRISEEVVNAVNELAAEAQEMINFVQTTAMEGYNELVRSSRDYMDNTDQFREMIQNFSNIGEEIYSSVEFIKNSTSEIDRVVEDTAARLHKMAESSGQMTDHMREIEHQANASNDVADALYQEVGKFQLE